MKKEDKASIGVDKTTHKIFQELSKSMNIDLKQYMYLVAQYLKRTGQDITQDTSTAQEISKFTNKIIGFQKTYEKEHLKPALKTLTEYAMGLKEYHDYFETLKDKSNQILDAIRHAEPTDENALRKIIEDLKKEIEALKTDNRILTRFSESTQKIAYEHYQTIRSRMIDAKNRIEKKEFENAKIILEQTTQVYDKRFEAFNLSQEKSSENQKK
ncbi:MAG: hypothetical protein MUC49_21250 [Raineya sp.]|jgi:uncharacterized protein YdcH (DUF465 family)|nr:hypothetical protein [Raineya sp.]